MDPDHSVTDLQHSLPKGWLQFIFAGQREDRHKMLSPEFQVWLGAVEVGIDW